MAQRTIYLDYAATSYPKPPQVLEAMRAFLQDCGGNPGRSGHALSVAAGRGVYAVREAVARFFGVSDPSRVVFTPNVTGAINLVINGLLRPGDRVVTTGIEHNAVMRPLRALERRGIVVSVAPCRGDGALAPAELDAYLLPRTRLVVTTHASNVCGTLLPVEDFAPLVHKAGALLLVDAAQTAGAMAVNAAKIGADFLAFTGHKGLLGPPGTGGLVIGENVDVSRLEPLIRGGTGSNSELEEQPEMLPDRYESGTVNGVGLAGLGAGIGVVLSRGLQDIRNHERALAAALIAGLRAVPGVTVHGTCDAARSVAVVSFTAHGMSPSDIALRLEDEHGVMCRVGLHCAPAAHRTIGTFPAGTVRLAPGIDTTAGDIEETVSAVARVVAA
jgi:cysteine desulfurase family protein